MSAKSVVVTILLILLGVAGLLTTACGAFFSLAGLYTWMTGHGESKAYGEAFMASGGLLGLLPGAILLGIFYWMLRRRRRAAAAANGTPEAPGKMTSSRPTDPPPP